MGSEKGSVKITLYYWLKFLSGALCHLLRYQKQAEKDIWISYILKAVFKISSDEAEVTGCMDLKLRKETVQRSTFGNYSEYMIFQVVEIHGLQGKVCRVREAMKSYSQALKLYNIWKLD